MAIQRLGNTRHIAATLFILSGVHLLQIYKHLSSNNFNAMTPLPALQAAGSAAIAMASMAVFLRNRPQQVPLPAAPAPDAGRNNVPIHIVPINTEQQSPPSPSMLQPADSQNARHPLSDAFPAMQQHDEYAIDRWMQENPNNGLTPFRSSGQPSILICFPQNQKHTICGMHKDVIYMQLSKIQQEAIDCAIDSRDNQPVILQEDGIYLGDTRIEFAQDPQLVNQRNAVVFLLKNGFIQDNGCGVQAVSVRQPEIFRPNAFNPRTPPQRSATTTRSSAASSIPKAATLSHIAEPQPSSHEYRSGHDERLQTPARPAPSSSPNEYQSGNAEQPQTSAPATSQSLDPIAMKAALAAYRVSNSPAAQPQRPVTVTPSPAVPVDPLTAALSPARYAAQQYPPSSPSTPAPLASQSSSSNDYESGEDNRPKNTAPAAAPSASAPIAPQPRNLSDSELLLTIFATCNSITQHQPAGDTAIKINLLQRIQIDNVWIDAIYLSVSKETAFSLYDLPAGTKVQFKERNLIVGNIVIPYTNDIEGTYIQQLVQRNIIKDASLFKVQQWVRSSLALQEEGVQEEEGARPTLGDWMTQNETSGLTRWQPLYETSISIKLRRPQEIQGKRYSEIYLRLSWAQRKQLKDLGLRGGKVSFQKELGRYVLYIDKHAIRFSNDPDFVKQEEAVKFLLEGDYIETLSWSWKDYHNANGSEYAEPDNPTAKARQQAAQKGLIPKQDYQAHHKPRSPRSSDYQQSQSPPATKPLESSIYQPTGPKKPLSQKQSDRLSQQQPKPKSSTAPNNPPSSSSAPSSDYQTGAASREKPKKSANDKTEHP
ncbi:MAG: hypothetical protein HY861_04210 [Chlamydiia bacterium]|nr:hypothetical protein [Chlamydiia bacterium]